MISHRLKSETMEAHQALEGLIVRKIKSSTSKKEYAHLLSMFYGYYLPVEASIEQQITKDQLPDIASRRKAGWLLDDIAAMDATMELVELANYRPQVINANQAMGAMYVLEGSTLGGRHIIKMFQKALNIEGLEGFQFYNSYGEETSEYWKRFTAMLDGFAVTKDQEDEIIAAANDTFTCFRKWIEEKG